VKELFETPRIETQGHLRQSVFVAGWYRVIFRRSLLSTDSFDTYFSCWIILHKRTTIRGIVLDAT